MSPNRAAASPLVDELLALIPTIGTLDAETLVAKLGAIVDRIRAGTPGGRMTLDDEVRSLEQRRVRESLERNGGNLSSVARELGIARPRLYRILKREA